MPIFVVVIIRSAISFFSLLLFVRIMGKQQISELTFFDYIVGITIGSIASTISVQVNENTLASLSGMLTWTILAVLLAYLNIKNNRISRLIDGKETIFIKNGRLLKENLKKARIPIEQLLSELRLKGVFNISDIETAIFEPGGKLSIQKKAEKLPVTPGDLNLPVQYEGLPENLIIDGQIKNEALNTLNLSKAWLHHQLNKQSISDITQVTLAQLDTKGNLYVDLNGDKPFYTISTQE